MDVNDCEPSFVEAEYRVAINENLPLGTSVAAVMATDCDEGSNAVLRYSIAQGSVGVFQLDCKLNSRMHGYGNGALSTSCAVISGVITTLAPLDFEQTPNYRLTVTATDMGLPTRVGK